MHAEAVEQSAQVAAQAAPYLRCIPLLPLLGAIFHVAVGDRFGRRAVGLVACGTVALSFALAATASRLRGSAVVTSDRMRALAEAATSTTARSNAASLALDGTLKPLSFLTNCKDASRISTSVAGGSKLNSVS